MSRDDVDNVAFDFSELYFPVSYLFNKLKKIFFFLPIILKLRLYCVNRATPFSQADQERHSSADKCKAVQPFVEKITYGKSTSPNLPSTFHGEKGFFCQQCTVAFLTQTGYARYQRTGGRWRFFISIWSLWSWISTTEGLWYTPRGCLWGNLSW